MKSAVNAQLPNLESVANLMTRVGLLDEQVAGRRDDTYFSSIQPVALGLFRLVVMGEIKKGKSSFINALCGVPGLVPVHHNVATSTVFKIHHGPERAYRVFFQPDEGGQARKLEIGEADLNAYGTEDGNPENEKKVDFIEVAAPSPILADGLIVVDTPGVGGLFKKHREITYRHVPRADAVFFVTDSVESPIGGAEVDFLKELRRATPLIHFVQTKSALADEGAAVRRMENNIAILVDKVGLKKEDIRYFIVDSHLKSEADRERNLEDLEDSGFPPLMGYLQHSLKASRDRNIATVGVRRAAAKLAEAKAVVDQRRLVLDADTSEKQAALTERLNETEERLKRWNNEVRPQLVREFQTEAQTIHSELSAELTNILRPAGEISEGVGEALEQMKDCQPEEIYATVGPLAAEVRSAASEALLACSQELERRFTDLLAALSIKAEASISTTALSKELASEQTLIRFADSQLRELAAKADESRWFEKARTGLYGGTAGVGLAMVAGGVIGSVVPVVGTMIGSFVGLTIAGFFGGYQASEIVRVKESAAARREVLSAMDRDLQGCLVQAQAGIQKAFVSLRTRGEDALAEAIKSSMEQLAATQRELKQRARATVQEVQQSRLEFEAQDRQIAALGQELEAMGALLKPANPAKPA